MLNPGHPAETLPPDRPDPELVARTVNARMTAARNLAAYRATVPVPVDPTALDIERIVAVLADHAERLHAVELLADYAAERAELHDGG